jgi:hypothetical protein
LPAAVIRVVTTERGSNLPTVLAMLSTRAQVHLLAPPSLITVTTSLSNRCCFKASLF